MRARGLIAGLLVLAPLTAHAQTANSQSTWATYTNVRYAFAVDYPRDIFTSFTESDNSDGATFKANAPGAELRAYGSYNIDNKTPRAYVAEYYAGKTLTYSSVKRTSYVVSGQIGDQNGGNIFYDRCNFTGDRVMCINLVYPAAEKAKWDKIVGRVSRSLRAVTRGR